MLHVVVLLLLGFGGSGLVGLSKQLLDSFKLQGEEDETDEDLLSEADKRCVGGVGGVRGV